ADTDLKLNAEILSYSRSKGIFAGVSLSGAVVQSDKSGDQAMYGANVDRHDIVDGTVRVAWYGAFTECPEGMRHFPHRRQQLSLYGVSAEAGTGENDPDRSRSYADWFAASGGRWPHRRLRNCAPRSAAPPSTQEEPQLPRKSPEAHGCLERSHGKAGHANRYADEAAGSHL